MKPGEASWVLITGCSSGIGRHAAFALQARGYQVVASARRTEDVESLRRDGLRYAIQLDVVDSDSIQAAATEIEAITGGRLAAVFNNAGYGQPGAVEDLSRGALQRQFETNVFGLIELTNALLPMLLRQPDARIVQNSSLLGLVAMRFRGAYNASKFALEGLTDTLRLELKGTGVKVVLIEPGPITSNFRVNAMEAFDREIQPGQSRFSDQYDALAWRLQSQGAVAPFTLGPEAVTNALIKALEAKQPRSRYSVTFPTRLFALLRRCLPTRWLDVLLRRY